MNSFTFGMLKPDVMRSGDWGKIIAILEQKGFRIIEGKTKTLSVQEAETFYKEHKGKPFFEGLIKFTISGPVFLMFLQKENAVTDFRKVIGSTNPIYAAAASIRYLFGKGTPNNAIHGSDCCASAIREIEFFFNYKVSLEIYGRIESPARRPWEKLVSLGNSKTVRKPRKVWVKYEETGPPINDEIPEVFLVQVPGSLPFIEELSEKNTRADNE